MYEGIAKVVRAASAPPMTILNNALMNFWNFSVNAVTKETTSKHKSTKLSMSHVKPLSTSNTRNPTTIQYLSLPATQVYQILIISLKNIILSLRPLIAVKMPLKIHLFLPTLPNFVISCFYLLPQFEKILAKSIRQGSCYSHFLTRGHEKLETQKFSFLLEMAEICFEYNLIY